MSYTPLSSETHDLDAIREEYPKFNLDFHVFVVENDAFFENLHEDVPKVLRSRLRDCINEYADIWRERGDRKVAREMEDVAEGKLSRNNSLLADTRMSLVEIADNLKEDLLEDVVVLPPEDLKVFEKEETTLTP